MQDMHAAITIRPKAVEQGKLMDSLYTELFSAKTINGRYELSLEHLKEVNPKAAKEFTHFLEHETE